MSWLLIRHGMTQGNVERRYVGCRTDEPLCPQGVEQLLARTYPPVRKVFASPMKRCVETARLIYPGRTIELIDDLRECDFGAFENKNYVELNGRADYQAWIDSMGEAAFPQGESRAEFAGRCVCAFEAIRQAASEEDCALVAHGGTIMAIMERWARPAGGYYDFQAANGAGYRLEANGEYRAL